MCDRNSGIIRKKELNTVIPGTLSGSAAAYYHLDTTFDNTLGKSDKVEDIRYDYFNLDDGHIFKMITNH